jgi:hypothetical protein
MKLTRTTMTKGPSAWTGKIKQEDTTGETNLNGASREQRSGSRRPRAAHVQPLMRAIPRYRGQFSYCNNSPDNLTCCRTKGACYGL